MIKIYMNDKQICVLLGLCYIPINSSEFCYILHRAKFDANLAVG